MRGRETGIHWNAGDNIAEVVTADYNLQQQIRKAARKYKDIIIDQEPCEENECYMCALIPIDFINFKKKTTRNYTPEQRKKRSEQKKLINERKKQG